MIVYIIYSNGKASRIQTHPAPESTTAANTEEGVETPATTHGSLLL